MSSNDSISRIPSSLSQSPLKQIIIEHIDNELPANKSKSADTNQEEHTKSLVRTQFKLSQAVEKRLSLITQEVSSNEHPSSSQCKNSCMSPRKRSF